MDSVAGVLAPGLEDAQLHHVDEADALPLALGARGLVVAPGAESARVPNPLLVLWVAP